MEPEGDGAVGHDQPAQHGAGARRRHHREIRAGAGRPGAADGHRAGAGGHHQDALGAARKGHWAAGLPVPLPEGSPAVCHVCHSHHQAGRGSCAQRLWQSDVHRIVRAGPPALFARLRPWHPLRAGPRAGEECHPRQQLSCLTQGDDYPVLRGRPAALDAVGRLHRVSGTGSRLLAAEHKALGPDPAGAHRLSGLQGGGRGASLGSAALFAERRRISGVGRLGARQVPESQPGHHRPDAAVAHLAGHHSAGGHARESQVICGPQVRPDPHR
mmetsp:Transcript_2608/g.8730  ORF Transcript_2608/g.8730 Transcript_2608/m.8730 type:complete len:271 (-) Transcript_2608:3806-4618(-)